jgi:hypothetical protein
LPDLWLRVVWGEFRYTFFIRYFNGRCGCLLLIPGEAGFHRRALVRRWLVGLGDGARRWGFKKTQRRFPAPEKIGT